MADEITPGETRRWLERIERRMERGQKDTDDRMTALAKDMVPTVLWQAEHEALDDKVARHERDARETQARIEREIAALHKAQDEHARAHQHAEENAAAWSRKKTMGVIGIVVGAIASVVGAWIAAVLAAGGVH